MKNEFITMNGLQIPTGLWFMEPMHLKQYIKTIQHINFETNQEEIKAAIERRDSAVFNFVGNGIAVIDVNGPMRKGFSFCGASTVEIRKQIRAAVIDKDVKVILLHVDSPGGHVAGTNELSMEVRAAAAVKPVHAHIEDLGASAAVWMIAFATKITANPTAEIGSIGTMAVVVDSSEHAEKEGFKIHVISTGEHKGAFTDGAPITEDQLKDIQERIDDINEHFQLAVSEGRQLFGKALADVSDGRVFIAEKAQKMGLIDEVQTLDLVVNQINNDIARSESDKDKKNHRNQVMTDLILDDEKYEGGLDLSQTKDFTANNNC